MTNEITEQKPLVVANWKMNGLCESSRELITQIVINKADMDNVVICPPFTALIAVGEALHDTKLRLGAQDCHWKECGPHTGDVSAAMLKDDGCEFVIVGHSERRHWHGETSEIVSKKAAIAHEVELITIICVGESEEERDAGKTLEVIRKQVAESLPENASNENTYIAYEPIWAIGTGKTPSREQIEEVHNHIVEQTSDEFTTLYGGSVRPDNAGAILKIEHVGGLLVGSASRNAEDFRAIVGVTRI